MLIHFAYGKHQADPNQQIECAIENIFNKRELLYFHIHNYFNFQDLNKAGEFLDYSSRDVKYFKEQKNF